MRPWTRFAAVGALIALLALVLPASAAAAPPSRTAHYTIFTFNRVPILNILEVGTLTGTVQGTPDQFTIDWSFRGTTNGSPASASGTGSGSQQGQRITLNLDSISEWNVPGFPQPETGKTAFLSRGGFPFFLSGTYTLDLFDFPNFPHPIVSGVPIFIFPAIPGNLLARPNNLHFESSLGGGSTDVSTLPGATAPGLLPFGSHG